MQLLWFLLPPAVGLYSASASPLKLSSAGAASVDQPGPSSNNEPHTGYVAPPKKLHGQFIHITDIHPDPWYIPKGRLSTSCHRKKPKKEKDKGGFWGASMSDNCDSPLSLVNLTMKWLEEEWADQVDFVIWTGDSSRHDNDHLLPRTASEIYDLNRQTVAKMESIFTKRHIPIVPSLGNNDMYPHNIMYPGPNEVTQEYLNIWRAFIPFPSYQIFQRGAYFSQELVPNHLAAISLNTLYWYDSNKAVDGCKRKSNDPGRQELDWLEVQLDTFRKRKMQVWLTGHVPPTMGNYYPDCYLGYAELALRFQDTILGHLYGHMNVDHFFWIDTHEVHHPPKSFLQSIKSFIFGPSDDDLTISKKKRYSLPQTLRKDFKSLPPAKSKNGTRDKINYDDYVIVNVGPSVVPAFLPSLRVFRYNVTDWNTPPNKTSPTTNDQQVALSQKIMALDAAQEDEGEEEVDDDSEVDAEHDKGSKRHHGHRHDPSKIDCSLKKNRNRPECLFKKPRHASKYSPSRSNKLWTPLGYTQWYLPGIDSLNETNPPKYQIEYMTFPLDSLAPPSDYPVPQRLLPESLRNLTEIPEDMESELVPYHMKDLTIPSWIKLARRLASKRRLWNRFKSFMYLGGEED